MRSASATIEPGGDTKDWPTAAQHALTEALVMFESIGALANVLIDGHDGSDFSLLEAINACVTRARGAIEPIIDKAPA